MFDGNTKNIIINSYNSNNELIDLNGARVRWVLKTSSKKLENVIEKTMSNGITIEGLGKIKIKLNSSDTRGLCGNYHHACELIDSFDNVSTLLIGLVTIKDSGLPAEDEGIPDADGGTFLIFDDTVVFDGGIFNV
jgi:hypothetical protein